MLQSVSVVVWAFALMTFAPCLMAADAGAGSPPGDKAAEPAKATAEKPETPMPPGEDWQPLFGKEGWYKEAHETPKLFRGKLEAVPNAGQPGILQRTSYYRLGSRTVWTGAKKIKALDSLVGKRVQIWGKPVDMELEGQAVSEIWPAAVRPVKGKPASKDADKGGSGQ